MTTINRASTLDQAIATSAKHAIDALIYLDKASSKAGDAITSAMGAIVTAAAASGLPKTEKGIKYLMEHVRTCQVFLDAVAEGMLLQKTVTEYAQGVGRAFFHGCEWSANLKNDATYALPWGKAKPKAATAEGATEVDGETTLAGKAKPGKVKAITRDDAFETARMLLDQLRKLHLDSVASDVLDVLLEELEGFTETI